MTCPLFTLARSLVARMAGSGFARMTSAGAVCVIVAGCNSDGTLTPKAQNVVNSMVTVGCAIDTVLQPIATVVGPAVAEANGISASTVQAVVQVDGPLHQSVLNGCAAMKGTVTTVPVANAGSI